MELKDDSGVSVHAARQDEADSSIAASSNPVVFQCAQCDSIVGDSTSWVSANKIMRTITVGRVTSKVGVKPDIEVSQSGVDKGSTFTPVYCITCNEVLGKQYLASPPELDYIRGSFTLHVEKLNSYEVGSAQAGGNSDLADMVNVPSPGYLMARMNKMQFLIVSMNDRIKNLEACLTDSETSTQRSENSNRQLSTHGETENVSSTDNFSTRPRRDSVGSGQTDIDTVDGENNGCSRQDMFLARRINNDNFDYDRKLEQHTREIDRNNELLSEDRVLKKGVRSNVGNFRHLDKRSPQNELRSNKASDEDNQGIFQDVDNEEMENMKRNRQRKFVKRGRQESAEIDERKVGNEQSVELATSVLQGITTKALQGLNKDHPRPGWNNINQQGRNASRNKVNAGFTSPNDKGGRSVSRNPPVMETWPSPGIERRSPGIERSQGIERSPGIERRGRESKKRKVFDRNDSQ